MKLNWGFDKEHPALDTHSWVRCGDDFIYKCENCGMFAFDDSYGKFFTFQISIMDLTCNECILQAIL
jgi:hypothetical protein